MDILGEALARIATAKANAEMNLQHSRDLFASYLQSIFAVAGEEWQWKSLGSLAVFRNGINFTRESSGEKVQIVGVRNFKDYFTAPLNDLDTVTVDGELNEQDLLQSGDILTVRSNGAAALIGRCLLVPQFKGKISHSGFTIRIRLAGRELIPRYLCYFLKASTTRKLLTEGGTGTNIKSLNQGMLSALTVPFPRPLEQQEIVARLDSVSEEVHSLQRVYQQKSDALEALKESLLHQAFTGKL